MGNSSKALNCFEKLFINILMISIVKNKNLLKTKIYFSKIFFPEKKNYPSSPLNSLFVMYAGAFQMKDFQKKVIFLIIVSKRCS